MKIVKITTRVREGSPQMHLLCQCGRRDPQPESQETLKSLSSFHWWAHRFTGNSALGRLALPSFLCLRVRRSSRHG